MTWNPSEHEIAAILRLDPRTRYEYFVKHVADEGRIWSLRGSSGWVLPADDDGVQSVPVWPHRVYAASCANGGWHGYEPVAIDLHEWITRWLSGIERERRLVAVFPMHDLSGVPVHPRQLRADLDAELAKYD